MPRAFMACGWVSYDFYATIEVMGSNILVNSVLKMRRLYGPRSSTGKPELAVVDTGDILCRTRNFE